MAKTVGEANDIRAWVRNRGKGQRGGWFHANRDVQFAIFAEGRGAGADDVAQTKKDYADAIEAFKTTVQPLAEGLRSRTQILDPKCDPPRVPTAGNYLIVEWRIRPAGPLDDMMEADGNACGCGCGCGCGG